MIVIGADETCVKLPMTYAPTAACPCCGEIVPAGWPAGSCPRCLVQVTVEAPDDAGMFPPDHGSITLGDYELIEEIARGGMGVIYRGWQRSLNRTVAVKVLAAGQFASPDAQRRFRAEAEAAARLQHPGIVAIHDFGETDGQLWISMDFVTGENLAVLAREQPLSSQKAAQYVQAIADAVQHAHEHGVLHRDLKPSNVILDPQRGPCVTDFGIARCVDAVEVTRTGEMLGSPGYAAPEQALAGRADARTDVYGLGALLYHLLTARPPFQGPTLDSILLQLRETDPVSLRRLNPSVPRDLETICLRCLRKEPMQRYGTAREVAEDLARFLNGEAIRARPLGVHGRVWRWARRKPVLAALTLGLAVALAALGTHIAVSRKTALALERQRTEIAERFAREQRRAALLARAQLRLRTHDAGRRSESLRLLREAWNLSPSAEIRSAAITALALHDIEESETPPGTEFAEPETAPEHLPPLPARAVHRAFHSGVGRVAAAGEDKVVYLVDPGSGKILRRLRGCQGTCLSMAFSPDGHLLVTASADRMLRLWDLRSGTELVALGPGPGLGTSQLRWSMDGRWIEIAPGRSMRVSRPEVVQFFTPEHAAARAEEVCTIDLSADGRWLVTGDERGTHLWAIRSRAEVATFPKDGTEWSAARFSPESRRLWIGGWNSALRVVELPVDDSERASEPRFVAEFAGVLAAQSFDGSQLAALSNDGGGFQFRSEKPPHREFWLQQWHPLSLALSKDGNPAATSSFDAPGVRLWSLPDARMIRELPVAPPSRLAFVPDGTTMAAASGPTLTFWDTRSGESTGMVSATSPIMGLAFSADGRWLAVETHHGIDLLRGEYPFEQIARLLVEPDRGSASLCFSRDSRLLAVQSGTGGAVVWHLEDLRHELRAQGMDWDEPLPGK